MRNLFSEISLFIFFSVILVQKMASDNLNSGHFGFTQIINKECSEKNFLIIDIVRFEVIEL